MNKSTKTLILIASLCVTSTFARTWWHTTKITNKTGDCQLESNKITITTHPYHIDVVEEAVISTRGSVLNEASNKTLEILGQFTLTPGSSIRSFLLWNGDKILKAKLIDKNLADKIMDSIVNIKYIVDPALIKYLGNNQYSFRIYPVAIGESRKIRVLYSIPLESNEGDLMYNIQPVFTLGCRYVPTRIPVRFENSDSTQKKHIIHHGDLKKSIQYNNTYLLPFKDFNKGNYYYYDPSPQPICIIRQNLNCKAFSCILETTKAAGSYTAIFSTIPDTLKKKILTTELQKYTIEAKIQTSENAYLIDLPKKCAFSIYIKSKTPWNGKIFWNVYDNNGLIATSYIQNIIQNTDPVKNAILPLMWGARYSLVKGLGSLGGVFGFVDNKMSLLALEKDELSAEEAKKWYNGGVPTLLPNEIFADTAKISIPKDNIIIDFTKTVNFQKTVLDRFAITVLTNNMLHIQFEKMNPKIVSIDIYDMKGKLIISFSRINTIKGLAKLSLPKTLKGLYVMNIKVDNKHFNKKFILK